MRRKRQAAIYTAPVEPPWPPWVRLVILFVMVLFIGTAVRAMGARQRECRERGGEWETRPRPGHCVEQPLSYPRR